jgi:hypothetical protein
LPKSHNSVGSCWLRRVPSVGSAGRRAATTHFRRCARSTCRAKSSASRLRSTWRRTPSVSCNIWQASWRRRRKVWFTSQA